MEFTHPYRVGLVNINLSHGMRFETTDAREENNENRKKQQALPNNSIAAVRLLQETNLIVNQGKTTLCFSTGKAEMLAILDVLLKPRSGIWCSESKFIKQKRRTCSFYFILLFFLTRRVHVPHYVAGLTLFKFGESISFSLSSLFFFAVGFGETSLKRTVICLLGLLTPPFCFYINTGLRTLNFHASRFALCLWHLSVFAITIQGLQNSE